MKKALSLVLALLLLLSATAALAELNPEEKVELRFAWWGAQLRHDITQQMIDKYTELHPNVTIIPEFYDWAGYWDKLAAQGAGNALPDLIQMSVAYINQYYDGGLLLNLEPHVASGILSLEDIEPTMLDAGRLGPDKELYAMNLGTNALMMLYDPAVVEAAGIELKDVYTYDDLQAWGKTIMEKTGVYTNVYTSQYNYMMRSQGTHTFAQDGSGVLGFDDPALMAYFNEQEIIALDGGYALPPERLAEASGAIEDSFFVHGVEWNYYTWSNIASVVVNAAGREIKPMMYPLVAGKEDAKPLFYSTSQQICAAANSKYPEWCADFINFMVNSVEANEILLAERGIPVNAKVSEAIQPLLSEPAQMAAQYILDIAPYVSAADVNDPAWYGEVTSLLESYSERINYREMSPIDGITAWMADANKVIETQQP